MKKLLLFFMITLLPVLGNAQTLIDGIYYNLNSSDNTASVTNNSNGYYSGRIVIPEKVIYGGATYSVTSISEYAFSGCASLTGIIIPNSVTTIGEMAFYNCSSLMDIIIPNSVTTIEERAFKGCPSLNSVTIGTGVQKIGRYIFDGGVPAKVFWLPNTPPKLWDFYAEGKINYVSNSQYGDSNNTKRIKVYEFLSSMFEVDGVKYVPVSPSERTCDAIDYVYDMPVSEVSINTTVSYQGIDMKVLNVQPYSFYQNLNLKNAVLDIPGNISEYAFCGCTNLQTTILGSSITGIGEYAFSGCTILNEIIVPASVDKIGQYAFSGCTNMTSAIVGDGTKTIGAHAFSDCTSLTSATIGDSIRFFQQYAFSGCSLLQTITIPGSVRLIEDYTFYDCKSLKEIMVKAKNNTDRRTTYFDPIYVQRGQSETVTIYVAKGEELSFDYDSYMGSVTVSFLGEDIPINGIFFRHIFNKDGKVSITLKSSNATNYYSYSKITNVKLIESGSLLLGSNGNSPIFADCPLETVFIDRDLAYRSENNSGYSPFYNNKFLRSIVITNNGEEISDNEFYGCTNLQNVQIGDGVTSIGNWAFSGCSSLKSFSFGTNVSNIGKEAFSDCTAMTELISHATIPPTCGSQALDDINKWTCKLFVPKGCVGAYQAASQWKEFFFIEEDEKQKAEIAINEENFPDENFRAYLMSQSYGKDGVIAEDEIGTITSINVGGGGNISSLKGIEFFTALKTLDCSENQLKSLDVSKNTALMVLNCGSNQLSSLDVTKNTALELLWCGNNQLTSLDVTNNTALTGLYCHLNQLTNLDVSKNTALMQLWCNENQLMSLDVSNNTALVTLGVHNNKIKGEAMDALVESLPHQAWAAIYIIDLFNSSEENVCTSIQINTAREKGWRVLTTNGDDFEGSDLLIQLANGGFEIWAEGLPTGWKSASTASSATLTQSTDAHSGSYSVNVKGEESLNKRLASQEIKLAADTYVFSFWVKPTTSDPAQVRPGYVTVVDGKAGNYKYGTYETLNDGWQQVSMEFTLKAEATVCLVVMNPKKSDYSSGKDILVDDAMLTSKSSTGISTITLDSRTRNGIYDLNGRKLKELNKGINIIGGKKVVIK